MQPTTETGVAILTGTIVAAAFAEWMWYYQSRESTARIDQCTDLLRDDVRSLVTRMASNTPALASSAQTNTPIDSSDYVNVECHDDEDGGDNEHEDDGSHPHRRLKMLQSMRAVDVLAENPSSVRLSARDTLRTALDALHRHRCIDDDGAFCGVLEPLDVVRGVLGPHHLKSGSVRRLLRQCVVAGPESSLEDVVSHLRRGVRHVALLRRVRLA